MAQALFDAIDPQIEREVRTLVETKAAPFKIDRFVLRVGEHADGEETIFVDVWHPLTDAPVDARQVLEVQFAVRELLIRNGEWRFPLVRQHFADGQRFGTAA